MNPILTISDFIGYWAVATSNVSEDKLKEYILLCQEEVLRDVLGDEIANDLQIAIDALPTPLDPVALEAKYDDLIEGITYTDTEDIVRINKGLRNVLKGITYWKYVSDNFLHTTTGNVRNHNENANTIGTGETYQFSNNRYNRAASLNESDINPFLSEYRDSSDIVGSSTDLTGTYRIDVPNTLYLEDNDTITLNGTEYEVTSVILNTSFIITEATAGLDFTGDTYTWKPFKDVVENDLGRVWL